jgi:hypothetical protein
MAIALCDPAAFYPFHTLVEGPFNSMDDVQRVERFVRTVVLHDETVMDPPVFAYPSNKPALNELWTDPETGISHVIGAPLVVVSTQYSFLSDGAGREARPDIKLSPALVDLVSQFAGSVEVKQQLIEYVKRVLGIVEQGGSVLMEGKLAEQMVLTAQQYPQGVFSKLDADWRNYCDKLDKNGLTLSIPPVLGVILTRCRTREAIPTVVRDLRDEWSSARKKLWKLLDGLRTSRTVGEAIEIHRELAEATALFAPEPTEHDSRPVRILWEILASAAAGVGIAAMSGGKPVVGAITGAIAHLPRSVPAVLQEFGPAVFGRGGFDLARRVRRSAAEIELGALPRLLSGAEKNKLGLN